MKKLTLILIAAFLVIGISACDSNIVDIPFEANEPVVPVQPDQETDNVDTSPDVIVEFVDREVVVPATLDRQRRYLPGTYMLAESRPNNQNGYVFTVVVIDDYGRIAGVHIDQTVSTRNLFFSKEGLFYVFLTGNRTSIPDAYRQVLLSTPFEEYPTTSDALRVSDLVVGIDAVEIQGLTRIAVNETKQLISGRVKVANVLSYSEQMDNVAQKIINDNSTYGFNLIQKNGVLTTSSIEGITEALEVPLTLVQSILDGPAALPRNTVLRPITDPQHGVYQTGLYVDFSPMALVDGELVHGLSVVVVDDFGRLTGVYLDEIVGSTARASVAATKQILKSAVGLSTTQPLEWNEQADVLAKQIINNQGVDGLRLSSPTTFVKDLSAGLPSYNVTNMTNIAIRANEILLATRENLSQAKFSNYIDGTYLVSNPSSFSFITIKDNELVNIYIDRFVLRNQAQALRNNQVVDVERFTRQFTTPTSTVDAEIAVYSSGSSYYSLHKVTQVNNFLLPPGQTIAENQLMELTQEEEVTLRPVPGWHTASSLRHVDAGEETWISDQEKLATIIQSEGTTSNFQLVNERIQNIPNLSSVVATNVIELVSEGLFQARTGTTSGLITPFVPQTTPLADGAYFEHSGPTASGPIHYTFMVVDEGVVLTWFVDSTLLLNNRVQSLLFSTAVNRTNAIKRSNALVQSQTSLLYSLIEKAAPLPIIRSITTSSIRDENNDLIGSAPYDGLLDKVIREATTAKQAQDIQWIRDYFLNDETYFKGRTLIELQTITNWLPRTFTDEALSHAYRFVWRSSERDVFLTQSGETFSSRIASLDADSLGVIDLEIYLLNSNTPVTTVQFELPLRRRTTHGTTVLNSESFDFPSLTLLEKTQFALPDSSGLTVAWRSSKPNVMTAAGLTGTVTQATTVDLIAYIDLNANGEIDANEPLRLYSITVVPLTTAIARLRTELDSNLIGEFIGNNIILENKSSIWGLSYTWSTTNQNVVTTTSGTQTQMYIASLDVGQTLQLTANLNVPNNDISTTFRVDVGNRVLYSRFSTMDLPVMNPVTSLYLGQSIFQSFSNQGRFYRSQISFTSTDFGQFVNAQGVVIFQHPTIDACFDAFVNSNYGGVVETSATVQHPFCVLSVKSVQDQMKKDSDQLQNYVINLGMSSHVNTTLNLPLTGWVHQLPITYAVDMDQASVEYFDLTNLGSGIVVVRTTNANLTAGTTLRLTATIDLAVGTPPSKEIKIEIQG